MSTGNDGNLHLWECAHVLDDGKDEFTRCGYITSRVDDGPLYCPYDHGEPVKLVPLSAVVMCSDCAMFIIRDDCRAPDGRVVCGNCAMAYIRGGSL